MRVIVYVDGFNLYFGMKSKYKNVKWLNIHSLALKLLKPNQELVNVKYFTARIANNGNNKERRQSLYLDALNTTDIEIYYGHYNSKPKECFSCGNIIKDNEEKMTDVNIATQMIIDGFTDQYDLAMLISGDSDLVPPIREIKNHLPEKRIIVAFPPNRITKSLKKEAHGNFIIGKSKLSTSQFPNTIEIENGINLIRPIQWYE
ncbi:MAG: NYN domain-containing protein [Saprospiraceae bacterium]